MYLQLVFLIGLCVKNAIIPKKKWVQTHLNL